MKTPISRFTAMLMLPILTMLACNKEPSMTSERLLKKVNESHQTSKMMEANLSFQFRDYQYGLKRTAEKYTYSRMKDSIVDILDSEYGFERKIHGIKGRVADSMAAKYKNSLNSVLYFFQLPLVLQDPAAQLEYLRKGSIGDSIYYVLKVTFSQDQGGEDFEDEFRYWIHAETFEIDYLAYAYKTDGGGIRFREAINKRRIEGILFQDYINYKPASLSTSLDSLPKLFEKGKLLKVSEIVNTNIQVH